MELARVAALGGQLSVDGAGGGAGLADEVGGGALAGEEGGALRLLDGRAGEKGIGECARAGRAGGGE